MKEALYETVPLQTLKNPHFLVIENAKKIYKNGLCAVDGINLKLFKDQIFVLLGHNGAGKTSLVGILTGLFKLTQGKVELFGHDFSF